MLFIQTTLKMLFNIACSFMFAYKNILKFQIFRTVVLYSLLLRMNTNPTALRKTNVPLTPNLEDYKQKNKSKSKSKHASIPPTNPPTPKQFKAHITIKQNMDKIGDGLHSKQQSMFCHNHPNQIATHLSQNGTKKMCNKCYLLMSKNDEEGDEEVQIEKRRELDEFKGRIKGFGLKLQEASSSYRDWSYQCQQNFYDQKDYIAETFENLKSLIEQKKRQLINDLMICQQIVKKSLNSKNQVLQEIKSSIKRYIDDIDTNYQDIIESLSYCQFTEIIQRYNQKIYYLEGRLEQIDFETTLNVYIPKTQIQKYTEKSAVQIYPMTGFQETTAFKNKTLQRYTTEKNNILTDYQLVQTHQVRPQRPQHHESLNNKMAQHRRSRDRYELMGKDVSIGHARQINKENFYFDNLYH